MITSANLAPAEPLQDLARHPLFSGPGAAAQATLFAHQALAEGVRCRQGGQLGDAYLYYRFALYATFRFGPVEGLYATTANVFTLRSLLRDIVVRGDVSERDLTKDADEEWLRTFRASIDDTLRRMQEDALYLLPLLASSATGATSAHAAQHIATFAGDLVARRRWQAATGELAEGPGRAEEVLVCALEELEQSNEIEACGLALNEDLEREQRAFDRIWRSYEAHRGALDGPLRSPDLAGRLDAAFRHFEHLRFLVTANGGPMAHSFSFGLSHRIQMLGRDLMRLHLLRRGDARTSPAIAERVKARSLGDLMSREHYVSFDHIPSWFRNRLVKASGNVQSVEPANLAEVVQSVYGSGSALLVFVKRAAQFMAWAVLPGGVLNAWTFDDPKAELAGIFSSLPYLAGGEGLATDRGRDASSPGSSRKTIRARSTATCVRSGKGSSRRNSSPRSPDARG